MCLIGCTPEGRHIEQHDIFFGIASSAVELIRQMEQFWPDGGRLHLDAWRPVCFVDGMRVEVREKSAASAEPSREAETGNQLYFINLGGYQPDTFEEFHHKMITVQPNKAGAVQAAKNSHFYREAEGSHVDDQYGVDIDDLYNVEEILPPDLKAKYYLQFTATAEGQKDAWEIGYTKLGKLEKMF